MSTTQQIDPENERNEHNERVDTATAHEQAKRILGEIMASEREIVRLEQHIKVQKKQLETTCPHRDVVKEYDDDFHRPRSYMMCRLCGAEV